MAARILALLLGTLLAFEGLGRGLAWIGLGLLERPLQAILIFPALSLLVRWSDNNLTEPGAHHDS